MAHELEVNASTGAASMFYVGETPWHGLGTKLEQAPTSAEAIVAAGLNWEVESVPMMTTDGQDVPGQAIRRVTDKSILGVRKSWCLYHLPLLQLA